MLRFKSSIFSDENDLFIALHSNKARITEKTLRALAFKRGVLFPSKFNRDDLIGTISDLPFSYSHIKELTDRLTPKINRDHYSIKWIDGDFDLDSLNDVVEKVIENRPRMIGNETIDHSRSVQAYNLDIDYTEFDFSRGKFQQKKRHGGSINFNKYEDQVSIQFTFTPRIQGILRSILNNYRRDVSDSFEVSDVDLSMILDPAIRNSFVETLYESDKSFTFLTLEKVRVSRVHNYLETDVVDSLPDDSHAEEDYVSNESEAEGDAPNDDYVYNIKNAMFDGQALDDSKEITKLCEQGFYKSYIRWKAKANFIKSKPIVTLEMSFELKKLGKELKFRIVGKQALESEQRQAVIGADFDLVMLNLKRKISQAYENVVLKEEKEQKLIKEA